MTTDLRHCIVLTRFNLSDEIKENVICWAGGKFGGKGNFSGVLMLKSEEITSWKLYK
jgi:hypothetical protein